MDKMQREVWHVYYGTRGRAGAYIHAVQEACQQAHIRSRAFVSCRYRYDTWNVTKCFFPITDAFQSRNLFVVAIRAIEFVLGYIFVLILSLFSHPRINLSLNDDTIVTLLFVKSCKLLKLPLDLTCHDVIAHNGTFSSRRQSMVDLADRLIVHNDNARKTLRSILGEDSTSKIVQYPFPSASDSSILSSRKMKRARDELTTQLNGRSTYILFIGVVRQSKGIENLLDAFQLISRKKDLGLVIAGKWSGTPASLKERAVKLKHCILIDRYLTDDEFAAFIEGATVVVLPYLDYTHSAVLPSCADHKATVILSDIPMFREFLPNYSLFFEKGSVSSLANAIETAMDMDDSERMKCKEILYEFWVKQKALLVEGLLSAYGIRSVDLGSSPKTIV